MKRRKFSSRSSDLSDPNFGLATATEPHRFAHNQELTTH
jgi:hypothetical protein